MSSRHSNNIINNSSDYLETPGDRNVYYDDSASFSATFGDGYTFRCMIEYLYASNKEGSFIFSDKFIKYIPGVDTDENRHVIIPVLNDVIIDTSWLVDYLYDSEYPEFRIRVKLETIRSITRDIQKKNSLCMYKLSGDSTIYFEIIGSESASDNQSNLSHLKPIRTLVNEEFSMDEYQYQPESEPNCTIMATAFSRACSSFSHITCDQVDIRGYPNGFTIVAKIPTETAGKAFRFGTVTDKELSLSVNDNVAESNNSGLVINLIDDEDDVSDYQPHKIPHVCIPTIVLKSLSKIGNLSSNSSIKIFMIEGSPLKIIAYIGNYGTIRIYVRNTNPK